MSERKSYPEFQILYLDWPRMWPSAHLLGFSDSSVLKPIRCPVATLSSLLHGCSYQMGLILTPSLWEFVEIPLLEQGVKMLACLLSFYYLLQALLPSFLYIVFFVCRNVERF